MGCDPMPAVAVQHELSMRHQVASAVHSRILAGVWMGVVTRLYSIEPSANRRSDGARQLPHRALAKESQQGSQ